MITRRSFLTGLAALPISAAASSLTQCQDTGVSGYTVVEDTIEGGLYGENILTKAFAPIRREGESALYDVLSHSADHAMQTTPGYHTSAPTVADSQVSSDAECEATGRAMHGLPALRDDDGLLTSPSHEGLLDADSRGLRT